MTQSFVGAGTVGTGGVGVREQAFESVSVRRPAQVWDRVSWGAIIAGTLLALTTQMLLTLLGAGLGLVAIGAGADREASAASMGIVAGIWWLATGLISLFVGGAVAGRLCGLRNWVDGAAHGVMVWTLAIVLSVVLLATSSAAIVSGIFGTLRTWMPVPEGRVGAVISQQLDALAEPADQGRRTGGGTGADGQDRGDGENDGTGLRGNEPGQDRTGDRSATQGRSGAERSTPSSDATGVTETGDRPIPGLRDQPPSATPPADRNGRSGTEGARTAAGAGNERSAGGTGGLGDSELAREARERLPTTEEAREAAETAGQAAFWSFFALLLGAVAAGIGGAVGRVRHDLDENAVVYAKRVVNRPPAPAPETDRARPQP